MRRDNTRSIADVIRELVEAYKLENKLIEVQLIQAWEEVAGKYIARHTQQLYIHDRIFYVKIHSSIIKHELHLVHDDLLDKLNTIAGSQYLKKIVFI